MVDLKLRRLPDRTPVKLVLTVLPELYRALQEYAKLYGAEATVNDRVPAMLDGFLESDRAFAVWRNQGEQQ
ncbi:DUF2274 domain-containing protein [Sphingomonas sp. QA11]|uniref:DUF2274 domain-containing protein n=1 Tax=Sphingomonas sp. QA11 TaxID=2950605 RepID=UPI00234A41A6|nr:DUF2274 domain-containing protein [Sphingomonas sp. QA11]WCM25003.1 DUF2274 domain-containing protein [Sphingomonas sp. QA11]